MTEHDYGITETEVTNFNEGLPAGAYLAVILSQSDKENEEKGYSYVELVFEIVDGAQKGKKMKQMYIIQHNNEIVMRIARENLIRIAKATGIPKPLPNVFERKEIVIHVRHQKKDPERQEIWKYESPDSLKSISESTPF